MPREQPYEFVLEGGGNLEDVPAADVAAFITGVVRLVARAAGHAVGRPVKETGRRESIVDMASRVRLQSIRSGSVAISVLPALGPAFPIGDSLALVAETASERALSIVYQAVGSSSASYPDVAALWAEVGEGLGIGERYTGISIEPVDRARVTLDRPAIDRLRATAQHAQRAVTRNLVTGVLYEADFEAFTAKLRDPTRSSVSVKFDAGSAGAIKEALRGRTTLVGHVTYDAKAGRVVSVRVERVEEPLQLTADDFWAEKSVESIVREQGIQALDDAASLRMDGVSDEDWATFFEALGGRS